MPEHDENEEAVRNVEHITDSPPIRGEDILESEEAKRLLREAKQQSKSEQR